MSDEHTTADTATDALYEPALTGKPLIRIIGGFRAVVNGQAIAAPPNRRVAELLTYLLLMHTSSIQRIVIAELLYGADDAAAAQAALRNTLSLAQRWLREVLQAPQLLTAEQSVLYVTRDAVDVDVLLIEQAVTRAYRHQHRTLHHCSVCRASLLAAVATLEVDRLPTGEDTSAFDRWYSDRIGEFLTGSAEAFSALTRGPASLQRLRLATLWTRIDPFHEVAQRRLFTLLHQLDRRNDALRRAEQFSAVLKQHFGIEPEAETRALIARIRSQPGSLPEPTPSSSPVFGREAERAQLCTLLTDGQHRLFTICGVGGVGKTTLARSVAADLADTFSDVTVFVDLHEVRTLSEFAGALATALQLHPAPQTEPLDAAIAALHLRDSLVILDNCEQLADGAAAVDILLSRTNRPIFIATSRRPLNLRQEYLFELNGLSITAAADGQFSPALELLQHALQRSAVTADHNELTAHGPTIIEACNGLPLAIELVAGQARFRALAEIAATLRDQPELLSDDPPYAQPRRRSLLTVIEQTLALLPPDTQTIIAAMTLFSGAFDLHLLQQIVRPLNAAAQVMPAWQAAIELGLIRRTEQHVFRMHELVRRLIRAVRPLSSDEQQVLSRVFVQVMLEPIAAAAFAFVNEQSLTWIAQHRHRMADMRHAWQLADVVRDADLLRRAAVPLAVLANGGNWFAEYDRLLLMTIARLPDCSNHPLLLRLHGVRVLLGLYHLEQVRITSSVEWLLREPLPQPLQPEHALALRQRALQALHRGHLDAARTDIERSHAVIEHRELPMVQREPYLLRYRLQRAAGEREAAIASLHAALRVARQLGDRRAELSIRNELALIPARAGDVAAALPLLQQALLVARSIGDEGALPILLANSVRARTLLSGPQADSTEQIDEAIAIARRYGLRYSLRVALGAALTALPPDGPPAARITLLHEIMTIDSSIGLHSESIDYGLLLAEALTADGRREDACSVLAELIRQPICSEPQIAALQAQYRTLCGLALEPPTVPDTQALAGLHAVIRQLIAPDR